MRIKKTSQYIEGGATILDAYPIGSIYLSVSNTNPSTLFGGTWEQIQDTFLLSAGSTYTAGDTGGEATHTLTTNEMPSHNHVIKGFSYMPSEGGSIEVLSRNVRPTEYGKTTDNAGGGQAHNNMPPYLVVYMWKRTA